jgi:porin
MRGSLARRIGVQQRDAASVFQDPAQRFGIRENLSVGMGIENILGQNGDVIGVAASWEEPSNRALRDQYVVEAFYRFNITPHTHLTPDIQVVIDPANAPNRDAVTVFGLRLRTLY